MHHPTLCVVASALLAALPGAQAGLYTRKSPVLQVDAKDYDRLIAKSNYTSIVEFYAPWCGHCQNLKPAYEKAAKNLEGLAKVAAVNCDDDANKSFCGSMGVQGFPTLKIVRPKKGGGKPMVQDYQGPRTASAIVEAVVQQINNYVVKVEDKSLDNFLADKEMPKAILFTEKGATSALLKSIAIDFSGVITIGQARNKETKAVETFDVKKFPTLVLLPGGEAPAIVYDGELKKDAIVQFLSQAGQPNPDSPAKGDGKQKEKKNSKSTDKSSSAKAKPKTTSSKTSSATTGSKTETTATQEAPVIVETALPIPSINTPEKLIKECFTEKSHTCVLAFVSSTENEKVRKALESLSQLAFKHAQSKRQLFPFYEVPLSNEGAAPILKALDLTGDVEIVAVNSRRGWWRHYDGADFGHESVESWIDAIRLSEGVKKKLPEGIVAIAVEEPTSAAVPEASSEPTPNATEAGESEEATPVTPEASAETASDSTESTSTQATDPTAEPETAHDEL
ncbi:thioredoxin-domain-containing protein [Parathielavia appendiculata]|uniref:protein disulfide-isomerase n=1 Tax=Parathielavia appendiculata TaxID=2587402 RepID=A0AAN6UAV5_9PEZI|nr:thioredoxin-domain-containing protein [Parathielavia appendiculata]